MNSVIDLHRLEQSILKRCSRRGIHAGLDQICYSVAQFYQPIPASCRSKVLYVGVGHGLDALVALMGGYVENLVGVDPYQEGGNDEDDYRELLTLLNEYSLQNRFRVVRMTIEDYLNTHSDDYSLIVCSDVLHHIFETDSALSRSDQFELAIALFRRFANVCRPGGMLAVSDVQRYGLRPWLKNHGWLKGHVNYRTKQSWQEWNRVITSSSWKRTYKCCYVPYAFRKQRWLWNHWAGGYTLCDRYFLYYDVKC